MTNRLDRHTLTNGMTIIGEYMPQVASAAFAFLLPCGTSRIDKGMSGAGNVITDWVTRGAGPYNSKELVDQMDGLGLHRGTSIGPYRMSFSVSMESSCLHEALDLHGHIILRPTLEAEQFDLSRDLAIQELDSLDDEPKHKAMIKLKELFYGDPLGRAAIGSKEDLANLTMQSTAEIIKRNFNIPSTIFSIAGRYDFTAVCEQLEALFDIDQQPIAPPPSASVTHPEYKHFQQESSQVHIGIMVETPTARSDDYYKMLTAVSILSGGMSSRLFTEVREKRGLCYAIGANYNSLRDKAGISCYAGTTPEKAQETLDVTLNEFFNLRKNITQDELNIAKVGLKSSLIMKSESSMSRAASNASDLNLLGMVRTIDDIKSKIDAVSIDSIVECLERNQFEKFNAVTIGPKAIDTSMII